MLWEKDRHVVGRRLNLVGVDPAFTQKEANSHRPERDGDQTTPESVVLRVCPWLVTQVDIRDSVGYGARPGSPGGHVPFGSDGVGSHGSLRKNAAVEDYSFVPAWLLPGQGHAFVV